MIAGIDCPYCEKVSINKISCRRGEKGTDFSQGSINRQKEKYCNGTYTQCWCYKYLERAWGHDKNVKVAVCTTGA